jgi:prepilin signal peptidase PulO-like enzyme (type II secretory pathway)
MMFIYFFVAIFGLVIGSFLNVIILRLHSGESSAKGRSHCPCCRHDLESWDLVPVLSFIWLHGKCRYCQTKISWQYPLVELSVAFLFVLAFVVDFGKVQSFDWRLAMYLLRDFFVISALVVVFVYDLRWMLIPDSVVLPTIILALALNIFLGYSLFNLILGLIVGFGFFAIQYFVSNGRWIGGGDLRLGALLGVLLGWPVAGFALFLSYIFGGVVVVPIYLLLNKVNKKHQLPFGVCLVPAIIFCLFFGQQVIDWYLRRMYIGII